ncbi:hypothetical protein QJS10_CPB17g02152 [Acorus calamus]|uniref:Uncharacterized protein n=1 Tax=Acorus calamus TaxID=4465 RepID=A0AAV9CU83_ACOCL|nr:hypothetical protein QJS10_CPB17g02152 [Acorus calamus]
MMDNPWRSKCSSPWTPPPPFQAEETAPVLVPGTSGNQMEITRRHNFLPFAFHEAGLEEHMLIGKPGVSCNTGNMELGKSFLALLSGGHSFSLPSDFQGVSNFESPGASRRVSANASTTAVNSMNSGFSLAHMASFSGYDTNKITGNRVEHSYVTSEPLSTFRGSQVPTFQVNLQSADAPLHNSSSSKEVVQQDLCEGTDEAVLSLKKGWPVDTVPVNFKKNHNSTVRPSRVILSEAKYGHQERVSALSGKRPRVFCMGTTTTSLQHSGARAANPGDAVQLESGETIIQWRKMFFIMIGIRVPDDGNGWDWPEGISVFGGMDRSHANILPNLTKNTNTFQSACINGSSRFDEPWKNIVSDNRPHKERTVMEKLCNMIPNGQQRNPSEGCKPSIKSFMGYTHGACSFASNFISHTMEECPDCDSMPIMNTAAKGERNSGNWFVAEHIDLSANDGNQFSSNPCSKTMESFGVAPIINRCSISGDNFMDRNATSSNIELRLGQPSQCSPALGSSVSVAMRSQLLQAPFDLKKPHLCESLII